MTSNVQTTESRKMARSRPIDFEMVYNVEFESVIRGHHIYKDTWNPVIGENLECKSDKRKKAMLHDANSLGIYNLEGDLVGHVPVELSNLLTNFLKADITNNLSATVVDKRKKEKGLVVPAKFIARTQNKMAAKTLKLFLTAKKNSFPSLNLTKEEVVKTPLIQYPVH